jgi:hypothetical protein
LKDKQYLIHDRDPLFTEKFSEILGSVGITTIKISPKSPNMTEYYSNYTSLAA